MTITEFRDYSDPEFQASFRAYFAEIGITLRENTGVFREMQRIADEQGMRCLTLTEDGKQFLPYVQRILKMRDAALMELKKSAETVLKILRAYEEAGF